MTPLVTVQGSLASKDLSTDRALEVFIYMVSFLLQYSKKKWVNEQLLCVRKCPCNLDFCENGSFGR